MNDVLAVEVFESNENLADDDSTLNVQHFTVLELDVREQIPGSDQLLEDIPNDKSVLIFGRAGEWESAYSVLSVTYTFSSPTMLGCGKGQSSREAQLGNETYMTERCQDFSLAVIDSQLFFQLIFLPALLTPRLDLHELYSVINILCSCWSLSSSDSHSLWSMKLSKVNNFAC